MKKVRLVSDSECDDLRSSGMLLTKVEIRTKDNLYSEQVGFAKGNKSNPMTERELEDKFKYLAGLALSKEKTELLTRCLKDLEHIDNIDQLVELLY